MGGVAVRGEKMIEDFTPFSKFNDDMKTMTNFLNRKEKFTIYYIKQTDGYKIAVDNYNKIVLHKLSRIKTADDRFFIWLKNISHYKFLSFRIFPIMNGYKIKAENDDIFRSYEVKTICTL